MARYTVVVDACVLVPIALADTLLRIAEHGMYRPLWSKRILDETADPLGTDVVGPDEFLLDQLDVASRVRDRRSRTGERPPAVA